MRRFTRNILKWILKLGLLLFVVVSLSSIIFFFLAFETAPRHASEQTVSASYAQKASQFLKRVSKQVLNVRKTITISASEEELKSVLALTNRTYSSITGDVLVEDASATFKFSIKVILLGQALYANTSGQLNASSDGLHWNEINLGKITLSDSIADFAFNNIVRLALGRDYGQNILLGISNVRMDEQQIQLDFGPPKSLKQGFADAAQNLSAYSGKSISFNTARIQFYLEFLVDIMRALPREKTSLTVYLKALLEKTREQTQNYGFIAEQENLSALFALAVQVEPGVFRHFVANLNVRRLNASGTVILTLANRQDLAKHFVYSVALHILAKKGVSFSLGEIKEVIDTQKGGSGFSFSDIAADRAGIRFAEVAIDNNFSAQLLQEYSVIKLTEHDIFPPIKNLPDGLNQRQFREKFGDINSAKYQAVLDEIDNRMNHTAVLGIVR